MWPVVGGENDEGVAGDLEIIERLEDLSDGGVHGFDHAGVGRVVVGLVASLFGVLGFELLGRLNGGVHRVEGEVDEEGRLGVLLNPARDIAAEALGEMLSFRSVFEVGIFVGRKVGLRMSPGGAAKVGVEAVLGRVFGEMPFARDAGAVAAGLESFAEGGEFRIEDCSVLDRDELAVLRFAAIGVADGEDSMTRGVFSGHQGSAGRSAIGGRGVGLGETHSLLGEAVEVRGFVVFRPLAGQVGVSKVISVEEDYIRR